jgi:hypothetical protein
MEASDQQASALTELQAHGSPCKPCTRTCSRLLLQQVLKRRAHNELMVKCERLRHIIDGKPFGACGIVLRMHGSRPTSHDP